MKMETLKKLADTPVSRRRFLKGTGLLVVSFSLLRFADSPAEAQGRDEPPPALDGFLAVDEDGTVTAFTGKVELGTGVATALRQIVAEELGVAFAAIHWVQGDTKLVPNQGGTWGSGTIRQGGTELRRAAATARQALLQMASEQLSVPVGHLVAREGTVRVRGDTSTQVSYGELIGGRQFELAVDENAPVKEPSAYTMVGKPIRRADVPGKVTGSFEYVHNVRLPGMLHARVIRPPTVNATLAGVNEASVRDLPGRIQVVRRGNFLAVAAEREEQAIQAAQALEVSWTPSGDALPADAAALSTYMQKTAIRDQRVVVDKGDLEGAFADAAKTLTAKYEWPFQMHGMIGPSCAVADVRDGSATIWAGTQNPFGTQGAVADLLALDPQDVHVIYTEASGCYGRLSWDDVPLDAALVSQALGKPVRVQWMRQDEHVYEPKGPPHFISVRAGLDEHGNVAAWEFQDRSLPWVATRPLAAVASAPGGRAFAIPNGSDGGGEI
ncbi:MAG TPA: molybdopterin cofactor-binding domain-containing protein, partial [Trueperaceae bacterium]